MVVQIVLIVVVKVTLVEKLYLSTELRDQTSTLVSKLCREFLRRKIKGATLACVGAVRNKARRVCSLFKTFTLVSLQPPFYQKMFHKKNSAHFLVFCDEIFQIVFIET